MVTITIVICVAMQCSIITVFASEESSNALFASGAKLSSSSNGYVLLYTFDKTTVDEDADDYLSYLTINDQSIADVNEAEMSFSSDGLEVMIPASAGIISKSDTNKAVLEKGVENNGYITTVRYIYEFSGLGTGTRVYRSDNYDDYDEVTLTSISVPSTESANFTIYIYFSDMITSKKLADFQIRTLWYLKEAHGDGTTYQYYTDAELDLYYQYEMMTSDWDNSILYNMMFGCDSYNGLESFPGNHSCDEYDMTPQSTEEGTDLYTIYQLQEQSADETLYYYDSEGGFYSNSASLQPLVVQVHFDENWIQLVLKGDSTRDKDVSQIVDENGNDTGKTSFNENIAPGLSENMAVGFKAGLLFPNGKMLKEDVVMCYDPASKTWATANAEKAETVEDETLDNQEGYTDEELAALAAQSDSKSYIGTESFQSELEAVLYSQDALSNEIAYGSISSGTKIKFGKTATLIIFCIVVVLGISSGFLIKHFDSRKRSRRGK